MVTTVESKQSGTRIGDYNSYNTVFFFPCSELNPGP